MLRFPPEARELIDFGAHTVFCSNGAGIKRPRQESDLSEPPSATTMFMWGYTFILPFSL